MIVKFGSTPDGASVSIDDRTLCAATPCSRALAVGDYRVRMLKERYVPLKKTYKVRKNSPSEVSLELGARLGRQTV